MFEPGNQEWDCIVVGSGLGGLTTAAYLTTNGVRTLVLEQYDTVGGCSQVFRRKREFEFDVGVHYVGDCGPDGAITTILHGVGLDERVKFRRLDPDGFSTIVFPDFEFRVPAGWENYRQRLIEAFPDEERGLRVCLWVFERIGREVERTGAKRLMNHPLQAPVTATLGLMPVARLFDLCRLSRRARAVLCAESGDYASPPSRAPVAIQAGLMHHFLKSGAYYPEGGGQVLAANLLDVIRSHGGAVRTRARVERILIEDGRAVGVRLVGGETARAPVIVSNADIKRTYLELVGREHLRRRTIRRVERYRMALPLATVYLGLDIDLAERMPATMYWGHTSFDIERRYQHAYAGTTDPDIPILVTSTTVKDPDNPRTAPPGGSSVQVLAIVPPHHRYWRLPPSPVSDREYSRNPEYRSAKHRLEQTLIDRAAQLIPGLEDHIVWRESSTPITHQRYTLASDGTSYGLEVTPSQFGPRRPGPTTEIDGLYLTGASTLWGMGVVNTMAGGVGTASAILGRDLRSEIRAGRVYADRRRLPTHDPGRDPLLACRRLAHKPRSYKIARGVARA